MTEPRPWYTTKSFIASGVLLAIILIMSVATTFVGGGSGTPASGHPSRPDPTWGSRCGLAHGSQDPVVGPPVATWTLVGHIPAPAISGIGPGITDGTDRRCYAHSPLGALLAAANFLPTITAVTDPKLAMDHYVSGHLRDVYARQPAIPVAPNTLVQTTGFKLAAITRDRVDVTLALRVNGVLGYVVLPMRWTEPGDWRVQLLSTQAPLTAGQLDSLADYIPWSA